MEYAFNPNLAVNTAAQQDIAARRREMEALSKSADPEAQRAKLRDACEGFEAIFLQKMWEQMRATLPKDGLMHSKEEEMWQSMYDQELGKSMAASGGIGLADMMMRQLDRNDGAISDATRQSTMRRPVLEVPPAPLLPPSPAPENTPAGTASAAESPAPPASAPLVKTAMSGIYEGEAPQAGAAPDAPFPSAPAALETPAPSVAAEADATPASVRQTLDELSAHLAAQNAGSAAPTPSAADAINTTGPAGPVITRITYQTNLPPGQRKASPFTGRTTAPAAPYTAAPLSTATSPTASERPGSLPAPAAAPAAESIPAPTAAEEIASTSSHRATPGVPAPTQDILAGIKPRFIPTRFASAPAARVTRTTASVTTLSGATALAAQAGGPALTGPEEVAESVALGNPAPPRGSLAAPVTGDISSGFGWRLDPLTGRRAWHAGVDIKAEPGESVRAARSGVVTFAGEHAELGNLVVLDHGDGLRTFYGHNQELDVKPGQRVDTGTELAKAGASGRAAGPHLHFEVRRGDLALNPEPLLRQRDIQVADAR